MLFFYFVVKTMNWLVDIDGTVCDDIRNEEWHLFECRPLPGALKAMEKLESRGTITISLPVCLNTVPSLCSGSRRTAFHARTTLCAASPEQRSTVHVDRQHSRDRVTFKGDWEQTLNII